VSPLDLEGRQRHGGGKHEVVAFEERAPALPDLGALALCARDIAHGKGEARSDVAGENVLELADPLELVEMVAHHGFAAQRQKGIASVRQVDLALVDRRASFAQVEGSGAADPLALPL